MNCLLLHHFKYAFEVMEAKNMAALHILDFCLWPVFLSTVSLLVHKQNRHKGPLSDCPFLPNFVLKAFVQKGLQKYFIKISSENVPV